MRPWFAFVLLVGFASMALFGAMSMSHHENGQQGCAAAAAIGSDCLDAANSLAYIALHLKAFTSFAAGAAGTIITFLAFAAGLVAISLLHDTRLLPARAVHWRRVAQHPLQYKRQLDSWLALLQRRDPDLS